MMIKLNQAMFTRGAVLGRTMLLAVKTFRKNIRYVESGSDTRLSRYIRFPELNRRS